MPNSMSICSFDEANSLMRSNYVTRRWKKYRKIQIKSKKQQHISECCVFLSQKTKKYLWHFCYKIIAEKSGKKNKTFFYQFAEPIEKHHFIRPSSESDELHICNGNFLNFVFQYEFAFRLYFTQMANYLIVIELQNHRPGLYSHCVCFAPVSSWIEFCQQFAHHRYNCFKLITTILHIFGLHLFCQTLKSNSQSKPTLPNSIVSYFILWWMGHIITLRACHIIT